MSQVQLDLTKDDYERARERARELLKSMVSLTEWRELKKEGYIRITGKRGIYKISPDSQTEISNLKTGRLIASACLQLTIPAPTYDRVVVEYLLIKNAENFYWKKANIFSVNVVESGIVLFLMVFLIITLFANLLTQLI